MGNDRLGLGVVGWEGEGVRGWKRSGRAGESEERGWSSFGLGRVGWRVGRSDESEMAVSGGESESDGQS